MKLFLVRHGIAVDFIGGEIKSDAQRPLTVEGRDEAELVARALKKAAGSVDLLVSSPLLRARQTADIFAEVLNSGEPEISEALAPGGDESQLFRLLKSKKVSSAALFGHEPGMGELAQKLLAAEFNIPFKKAGICRIDVSEMPPSSPGVLKWLLTPRLARLIGKA